MIAELLPAVDVDGPRVRLGIAWAAVTTVAVALGPIPAALVFAPVALAAAGQTCQSWRRKEDDERRPYRPVAVGGATLLPLAALGGPVAVTGAAVLATVAALAASQLRWGKRDWDARLTIAIAVLIGVGASSVVVARDRLGLVPALALLAWIHTIDASTFIVGSGASGKWEGLVAGAAAAGALGLFVAAVLVPPFRGLSPVVLAVIPAALVPVGTMAASALVGRDEAPVPALRRLDAFLVAGPVWVVMAKVVLDLS